MPHTLALEKSRPLPEELQITMAHPPSLADGREPFVYMLLPHAGGYQVMRASLKQLLEIAEAVSNVPGSEPVHVAAAGADGLSGDAAVPNRVGFRAEDIARMQGRMEQGSRVGWVRFGDVEIDAAARVVTRGGACVPLAPLEFDLLVALFQRKGAAASREELMREIWTGKAGVTPRTVDTHIFNLRRKLEDDPSQPVHLLTVSKIGYRLKA